MAGNFSEAQRSEIAVIMAQAIVMIQQVELILSGQAQGTAAQENQAPRQEKASAFRLRDIEYFDLNSLVSSVEVKDSHNIYHNVFSFINRLQVKAASIDPAVLRQNIELCLLGAADD